jgi:hypothetical protein
VGDIGCRFIAIEGHEASFCHWIISYEKNALKTGCLLWTQDEFAIHPRPGVDYKPTTFQGRFARNAGRVP